MTKILYPVDRDKYITTFPTRGIAMVFIAWTRLLMMGILKNSVFTTWFYVF